MIFLEALGLEMKDEDGWSGRRKGRLSDAVKPRVVHRLLLVKGKPSSGTARPACEKPKSRPSPALIAGALLKVELL